MKIYKTVVSFDTQEITKPQEEGEFYIVLVQGQEQPESFCMHKTFKWARNEAMRIARKMGVKAYILRSLKSFEPTNDLVEVNYRDPNKL